MSSTFTNHFLDCDGEILKVLRVNGRDSCTSAGNDIRNDTGKIKVKSASKEVHDKQQGLASLGVLALSTFTTMIMFNGLPHVDNS